ncbi:MAG: nucleoside hydrolase [Lentisphaeria bacterium]|nr:nucleoside hydrolase [Lentisphaeria bacterium]
MNYPEISAELRKSRLEIPQKKVRAILDTDTYNEIDDQFALTFALMAKDKLDLRAVTAAPFFNTHSTGPADGMERSYQEILNIFSLMGISPDGMVFRGSTGYLPAPETPVESDAARRIIELAKEAEQDGEVLYVLAIGAITNVASAILLAPEIIRNIVVVWLGGHAFEWHGKNDEFNLYQDVPAAQVIFDSRVPFVMFPCSMVTDHLLTTEPELKARCKNSGRIGEYLYTHTYEEMLRCGHDSRVIWDIVTVAYFVCPEAIQSIIRPTAKLNDDGSYDLSDTSRHEMRYAYALNRDIIFRKLFESLSAYK